MYFKVRMGNESYTVVPDDWDFFNNNSKIVLYYSLFDKNVEVKADVMKTMSSIVEIKPLEGDEKKAIMLINLYRIDEFDNMLINKNRKLMIEKSKKEIFERVTDGKKFLTSYFKLHWVSDEYVNKVFVEDQLITTITMKGFVSLLPIDYHNNNSRGLMVGTEFRFNWNEEKNVWDLCSWCFNSEYSKIYRPSKNYLKMRSFCFDFFNIVPATGGEKIQWL